MTMLKEYLMADIPVMTLLRHTLQELHLESHTMDQDVEKGQD